MQINNIKVEYCSDQFNTDHVFDLEISEEIIEAIKERRQAFARLMESFPNGNDQLCFFPTKGVTSDLGTVIAIHIMATPFENDDDREGFMLELNDADGYTYESEWLPFEALEKERFLLFLGDDDEVYRYGPCDDYDLDDYDTFYANTLEEAEEMLRAQIKAIRDADPAYYGHQSGYDKEVLELAILDRAKELEIEVDDNDIDEVALRVHQETGEYAIDLDKIDDWLTTFATNKANEEE